MKLRISSSAFIIAVTTILNMCPAHAQGTMTITVQTGGHYTHSRRFMLVKKITLTPQMAFWLADGNGNHLADLAVTYRSAQDDWRGGFGDVDRPEALPVWSHARNLPAADGGMMPEDDTVLPDAVTIATPERGFSHECLVPDGIKPGAYAVMAEVNTSYDYNDTWQDNLPGHDYHYSGVNGQPSVVWRGIINIGDEESTINLQPFGHGSPTGSDGDIDNDLESVSEAIDIVSFISVTYKPAR